MAYDRDETVKHILAIEKHIYQWVQLGGIPSWAETDLTMPQLKVLILVDRHHPMPTSQVARTLGMTLSTATGVVDRLVSQELIERLEDPADRRVV
ncbi:MAG TPA: MarR family transcriptional regulator, partial [Chloroflexota bacterium]|nr:MarR family transcriptional regulator [Chloroflexota bacterium]